MSEWTTPPQSAEYRTPTSGLGVLRAMITSLSRRISALEGAAPLKQAGIYLTTLGMRIASSLTVEGDLTSTGSADITGTTHIGGATTISGTLDVTGAATLGSTLDLSGTGTVTGALQSSNFMAGVSGWRLTSTGLEVNTITVKDLLIGNGALASPTTPVPGNATTGTIPFATSTTPTNHAPVTFTVPAGFTTAAVIGVSSLTAFNVPHTVATVIAGTVGDYVEIGLVDGTGSSSFTRVLTGLSGGGTFTVETQTRTGSGTGNAHAMTSAMVTFYR